MGSEASRSAALSRQALEQRQHVVDLLLGPLDAAVRPEFDSTWRVLLPFGMSALPGHPEFAALVLEQRALSPSRAGLEAGHGVVRGEVSRRDRDRERRLGALDHVAEATDR